VITVITLMSVITVITLITHMTVCQHTGPRLTNLIFHRSIPFCRTNQQSGICSLYNEDEHGTQDHLVDYEISIINRNHCNQSVLRHAETGLQSESHDKDCTVENNNTSPEKARASRVTHSKKRCPHHPHAPWGRFDTSGPACARQAGLLGMFQAHEDWRGARLPPTFDIHKRNSYFAVFHIV
jgi:hypothetical protein